MVYEFFKKTSMEMIHRKLKNKKKSLPSQKFPEPKKSLLYSTKLFKEKTPILFKVFQKV
jgi:hypothetical protein